MRNGTGTGSGEATGLTNSKKQPVANRELWEELLAVVEGSGHTFTWVKVAGHADQQRNHISSEHELFNQRCDELAVAAVPPRAPPPFRSREAR